MVQQDGYGVVGSQRLETLAAQRKRRPVCLLALEDAFEAEHELGVHGVVLDVKVANSSDDQCQWGTSVRTVYVTQLPSHCVPAKWELELGSGLVIQPEEHMKGRSDELDEKEGLQLD